MATPCSCHVIDTARIQNYLRYEGAVFTIKMARKARADLHAERRAERLEDGLEPRKLCGICADYLLAHILELSAEMYPELVHELPEVTYAQAA